MVRARLTLHVSGPESSEHSHEFSDMASMVDFLRWYTGALASDGWELHVDIDRRLTEDPPPTGGDRRRSRSWLVH